MFSDVRASRWSAIKDTCWVASLCMVHRPVDKGWGTFDKEHKNFGYFMHIMGFCKLEHNMLVGQTESEDNLQFSPVSLTWSI